MKRFLVLLTFFSSTALAQQLKLAPCTMTDVAGLCGTYSVPEDRTHPQGKHIALRIFVVSAPTAKKAADPLFLIQGGPGMSTVEILSNRDLLPLFRAGARDRDIVAIEERGVGGPDALVCPSDRASRTLQDDFRDYADIAREFSAGLTTVRQVLSPVECAT